MAEEPPRCTARSQQSGERCRQRPMAGAPVCQTHGGRAPQVRAKAKLRVLEQRARQTAAALIVAYEGEVSGDPLQSLLRMVHTAARAERAYAELLQSEVGPTPLMEVDFGKAGGLRLEAHPYLRLWNEERDRLAKVSKAALDAGVSEREVQVAEEQAERVVTIIVGVIDALPLTDEQRLEARRLAAAQLREVPP